MNQKMISLSGTWEIVKDAENLGTSHGWQETPPATEKARITVPEHIPNSEWTMHLSYSNVFPKYHGYVWYYKSLDTLPAFGSDERVLVEFEHAGYFTEVFVNGVRVGEHRDHEKRFCFDITECLCIGGENLLTVRCFEPRATGREIDGIRLHEIPNSCWADVQAHMLGAEDAFCLECVGGILGSVHLRAVPAVRIDSLYVRPDFRTGEVTVAVDVINVTAMTAKRTVSLLLTDRKSGTAVGCVRESFEIPVGASTVTLHAQILHHQLWDLDTPNLYLATVDVDGRDPHTVRFGFRDFRIQNGFFHLNGRRIFLKGAHCGVSTSYAISMKALGFNMIRTIARAFPEELLNVCDEIGLLVIDAAASAWGMTFHKNTRHQIEEYNQNLICAHRNHPCIAAYCLFNEMENKEEIFACGRDALPMLCALAPDTLFLLHSGRWDRDITLGSASNPGSVRWDTYLGAEGDASYEKRSLPFPCDGYNDPAMGDVHIYMSVPIAKEEEAYLRRIGKDTRPVFVSESGIASQADPMGAYLSNCKNRLSTAITVEEEHRIWRETEAFLDFYGLRDVYLNACDFSRDTERLNGRQRTRLYNIYRSNPMINGFSFTSFGTGNEGTLQGNLVLKNSIAYAIQQGHEPLRWALFTSERTVYAMEPFEIEAVLCNEDVLPPGDYAAEAYVRGRCGCIWKRRFTVHCPKDGYGGMPPLAVPAIKEELLLPAGEYTLSVRLLEGGVAYDGDLAFTVCEPPQEISASLALLDVSENVRAFLAARGADLVDFDRIDPAAPPRLILVGDADKESAEALSRLAEKGCTVLLLDPAFLAKNEALLKEIAGEGASLRRVKGSIYHHDHVNLPHPVFEGINTLGVLDFDKLGATYPDEIFVGGKKPTQTVSAALRIDPSFTTPGLSFGEYRYGEGRFVLQTFRLSECVGSHPYADLMLSNAVTYYGRP